MSTPRAVKAEILAARRLCTARGWPVIDVTRRSIEETAATVLQLMEAWHARRGRRRRAAAPEDPAAGVLGGKAARDPAVQAEAPALVLASPRAARRALLEGAGLRFEARAGRGGRGRASRKAAQAEGIPRRRRRADAGRCQGGAHRAARAGGAGDRLRPAAGLPIDGAERWFDKPPDLAAARDHLHGVARPRRIAWSRRSSAGGTARASGSTSRTPRLTMRDVLR